MVCAAWLKLSVTCYGRGAADGGFPLPDSASRLGQKKLFDRIISKYPPAEPGALGGEPLKAAIGGATRPQ
jgi:hypothetical protein